MPNHFFGRNRLFRPKYLIFAIKGCFGSWLYPEMCGQNRNKVFGPKQAVSAETLKRKRKPKYWNRNGQNFRAETEPKYTYIVVHVLWKYIFLTVRTEKTRRAGVFSLSSVGLISNASTPCLNGSNYTRRHGWQMQQMNISFIEDPA